jgi:hypothetical protein
MRTLPFALVLATLTIPSAGHSQDQGLVGGKVGADLGSSSSTQPGSSTSLEEGNNPYGAPPRAPQERPGFAGTVSPGQVVSRTTPIQQQWGGTGIAYVNGQRVKVDLNSRRIIRGY